MLSRVYLCQGQSLTSCIWLLFTTSSFNVWKLGTKDCLHLLTRTSPVRNTASTLTSRIATFCSSPEVNQTMCSGVTTKKRLWHFCVLNLNTDHLTFKLYRLIEGQLKNVLVFVRIKYGHSVAELRLKTIWAFAQFLHPSSCILSRSKCKAVIVGHCGT